ncbi:hypothetical protein V498_00158 [Pseudogymnoascus sp. VKM F-4517 (FW-2822)]|nr:hypothetical protein V498_00158 [Pseudogymnoascus sp. VKM F-4517 (FW-2822)]
MYSDPEADRAWKAEVRKRRKEELSGGSHRLLSPVARAPDPGWQHQDLLRRVCLRYAKRLGREPVLECVFPPTHTKCTCCTRLKDKCVPIPLSVALAALEMVNDHLDWKVAKGAIKEHVREKVVAAANSLPADIRVAASVAPSPAETNAALLCG